MLAAEQDDITLAVFKDWIDARHRFELNLLAHEADCSAELKDSSHSLIPTNHVHRFVLPWATRHNVIGFFDVQ